MSPVVASGLPPLLVLAAFMVVLAALAGALAAILGARPPSMRGVREAAQPLIRREQDIAAGLGWRPKVWLGVRVGVTALGLLIGVATGIPLLVVVGGLGGFAGFRWALAGRAAARRLAMERAFLSQLRNLRDRMAIGNQSLDTALQEIGRHPGAGLRQLLAPLAAGGSVVNGLVEVGELSRSPVIEYACAVLLWSRTRSLTSLIEVIDEVLLDVGAAQLAIEEESLVTLSQQRAVTLAMTGLMAGMFAAVIRVDSFREFYRTGAGQLVLLAVLLTFSGLVVLLGALVPAGDWTRWDLHRLARERDRLGG